MNGVVWAAAAGLVFGLFQAVNRASLIGLDVYESTFIQLLVSLIVLVAFVVATGELGRIEEVSASGYLYFGLSGLVHFFGGWTLLNQSQKLLGAARTSPLLASTPLFGTILAVITLGELPGILPLAGMASIVIGVTIVHLDRVRRESRGKGASAGREPARPPYPNVVSAADASQSLSSKTAQERRKHSPFFSSLFGLGAALAWAVSPIFIRRGLQTIDAPLIGVTIGVLAATVGYGLVLAARRRRIFKQFHGGKAIVLKLIAGVLVGLATWSRWYALSLTQVTIVLSLGLLSVPTVLLSARLFAGRDLERISVPILAGAALVVGGALILILPRVGGGA